MGTHLYLVRISLIFATQVSPFFSCKSFSVDSGQKPTVLELNLLSQSRPPLPTVSFLLLLSIQVCLCTELKLPLATVSDVVNHCLKTGFCCPDSCSVPKAERAPCQQHHLQPAARSVERGQGAGRKAKLRFLPTNLILTGSAAVLGRKGNQRTGCPAFCTDVFIPVCK